MSLRNILEFERIVAASEIDITIKLVNKAEPLELLFNCVEDIKHGNFSQFETGSILIPQLYHFTTVSNYKTEDILANFMAQRLPLWCRIDGPPETITFSFHDQMLQLEPRIIIYNQLLHHQDNFSKYLAPFLPVDKHDYGELLQGGLKAFQKCQRR